ncbi:MAG: lipopolysaccharide heptosyltransferase II [Candidatus Omnitrophica bacterium]|nr:lipopolysaccharide heptosyltransferase II [Candidatus Omnitrophota bacterium]
MKILIVTKNWLGDILFELPAIEAIKQNFPQAEIVCMTAARCRTILRNHPAVDRVLVFDEKAEHRNWFSRIRFLMELRKEKWDRAYFFHRSKTRAFLLWLAGIQERIGYSTKGRQWFLTQAIPEPAQLLHHVDYFMELLKKTGHHVSENASYHFYFSEKDQQNAQAMLESRSLGQFAVFHLGANWEPKRWPAVHFAKLADLIFEKWGLDIVVTGAPEDQKLVDEMMKDVKKARVTSLVGKTSLSELGGIYEKARFMVSGDSGPMHIAAGVGLPVLTFFGPTNPALTGPRGAGETVVLTYVPEGYQSPWYGKEFPATGWLSHIKPEEVFRAIEEKGWAIEKNKIASRATSTKADEIIPKQILVITLSNLGDVILTTPVITALHEKFPEAKITVVVGPRAKAILERSPWIHRLVVYDKTAKWLDKLKFLRELWRDSYDYVVDLRHSAIPYLIRAKKRSPILRFHIAGTLREKHLEVLRFMGLAPSPSAGFTFYLHEDEINALEKLKARGIFSIENCILIAPAAASELKTWRLAGFEKVIEGLIRERSENIILIGGKREKEIAEPLVKVNPARVHNMAGETSFAEMAALLSRCAMVLTNDSSVMHVAHEIDRPVVAIFGPTNPVKAGRVGPHWKIVREEIFCSPCDQPRCRFERQACMEDLAPEKVLNACLELLQKKDETLSHSR